MAEETEGVVETAEVAKAPVETQGGKKKIRGFVELVKAAWDVFAAGWVKTTILYAIMLVGILAIALISFGPAIFTLLAQQDVANPTLPTGNIVFMVVGFIALLLFAVVAGLALSRSVLATASGKPEKVGESIQYSLHNFLPFFAIGFVVGLLVLLGFVLLVIPGIILVTMYFAVQNVFILEENHSLSALTRSAELTKGYRWAVLGRLALFTLVLGVVTSILGYIPLVSFVLPFVTTPLAAAYSYGIYKDLVALKA